MGRRVPSSVRQNQVLPAAPGFPNARKAPTALCISTRDVGSLCPFPPSRFVGIESSKSLRLSLKAAKSHSGLLYYSAVIVH